MEKEKLNVLVICALLVMGILVFIPSTESKTIYVSQTGSWDYIKIQDAIDNATDGDTIFVFSGYYNEDLVISKEITLIGYNKYNTIINGSSTKHTISINHNNVVIKTFTIFNSSEDGLGAGVFVNNTDNCLITDSIIERNHIGIFLNHPNNITIEGNLIINNRWGLFDWKSNNTKILKNNISNNNQTGIGLYESKYSNVVNNTIYSNSNGFEIVKINHAKIYHNKISYNLNQVYFSDDLSINITWDNGTHGNWWTDYNGMDLNGDGIGDTLVPHPYTDQGYGYYQLDSYPLIENAGVMNEINLYLGWNLISLPHLDIQDVLDSINNSYDAIQGYDSGNDIGQWKHYHKLKPKQQNRLEYLNYTVGFWIRIINQTKLFIEPLRQPQNITLVKGWNLIGYPSNTTRNRTRGLNNIVFGQDIDNIQYFDNQNKTWKELEEYDYFKIGLGYWFHSKVNKIWVIN